MDGAVDQAVAAFFEPRVKAGDRVCAALSGGRDSVALLHALLRWKTAVARPFSLSALHIHHGLSPRADEWVDFCRAFCQAREIPLAVARVRVARDGKGIESAARRARYAVFAAQEADWLALAHHEDDQAETVLLNLLRGAGVPGAAGMPFERAAGAARSPVLARPLLGVPRAAIDAYVRREGLSFIEDESNRSVYYRRNYLRQEILPRLETSFPGARVSLVRAAQHFAESGALLDELAAADREKLTGIHGRIALAGWAALSLPRAKNLLRFLWKNAGFSAPDARWLDEAIKQLSTASPETRLAAGDGELRLYRGELYLMPRWTAPTPARWDIPPENETRAWGGGCVRLVSAQGMGIRRDALGKKPLILQPLKGGERFKPHAKRPRKALSKLFQEAGIPPWERKRLPSLWIADELAWVGGLGIDTVFSCADGEAGVMPFWLA